MADTNVQTKTIYTFKNLKSEKIAHDIRAENATEAQYIAGVNGTAEFTTTTAREKEYKHTDTLGHIAHPGSP